MPDIRYIMVCVVSAALLTLYVRQCREADTLRDERNALAQKLALAEETIEVKEGVFQKSAVEMEDLKGILSVYESRLNGTRDIIERQKAELVAVSNISLKWKRKYEGLATNVTETEVPPPEDDPDAPTRVRVDFAGSYGPFDVEGHTLTSPPEAHLSLEQARPIDLGVQLIQLPDGKWSTIVSTPEGADYEVDISLSAVDSDFERIDWRDKLSVDLDVGLYETPSLGVGVRYGSVVSVGPKCSVYADSDVSWSCGAALSWRPFDR